MTPNYLYQLKTCSNLAFVFRLFCPLCKLKFKKPPGCCLLDNVMVLVTGALWARIIIYYLLWSNAYKSPSAPLCRALYRQITKKTVHTPGNSQSGFLIQCYVKASLPRESLFYFAQYECLKSQCNQWEVMYEKLLGTGTIFLLRVCTSGRIGPSPMTGLRGATATEIINNNHFQVLPRHLGMLLLLQELWWSQIPAGAVCTH